MEDGNYQMRFEDLWRQMGEEGWAYEVLGDSTVRIKAEGVEMTYANAPTYDAEVYGLAAIVGSVDGLPDAGTLCEEALVWNAAHDVTFSLIGDGQKLRSSVFGDAQRIDADRLRNAIRQVIGTVAAWRGKTNAAMDGGAK